MCGTEWTRSRDSCVVVSEKYVQACAGARGGVYSRYRIISFQPFCPRLRVLTEAIIDLKFNVFYDKQLRQNE